MSISASTVAAIQRIGAGAFAVKEKLRKDVKAYSDLVNNAVATDADQANSNILFEKWKAVARLSQNIERIEEDLKKAYQVAFSLTSDDTSEVLILPAPRREAGQGATMAGAQAPTDVKVKTRKMVKSVTKKVSRKSAGVRPLGANPTKLIAHLEGILNSNDFAPIVQIEISNVTGIPMGSMSAALKKLVAIGRLVAGPAGTFKLTAPAGV